MLKAPLKKLLIDTPFEIPIRRLIRSLRRVKMDEEMLGVLRRSIKPDSNCIDIGAHAGDVLREIIKLAPDGKHFAFEPLPYLNRRLSREFPTVTVFPQALSDETGTVTFYHALGKPGWSGLKQREMETETLVVPTARLDDLVKVPIHFIKIDVEGAELSVMRGAERIIQFYHPVLLFEHCKSGASYFGTKPEAVFDFLKHYSISTLTGSPLTRAEFSHTFHAEEANDFLAVPIVSNSTGMSVG